MASFGITARTLNVDSVVDCKDAVFDMCRSCNIAGFRSAFSGGRASPIVDPSGVTLLHVSNVSETPWISRPLNFKFAACGYHLETCIWLLDRGADADRANI